MHNGLIHELSPHLDANSVVIMDNARIHKTTETQALIQRYCLDDALYPILVASHRPTTKE